MDNTKIFRELAFEVVGLGQELKAINPTYEQLQNAYCEDSSNIANSIADFSEKSAIITAVLTNTASSEAVTVAKAAAYDRVKETVRQFAAHLGIQVTCEAELAGVLQMLFAQYNQDATAFGGINPVHYAHNLSELCRVKDAEIATLKQQLQSLQPNGGIILPT